ncbi:beta-lactamase/transpeptidase-like protein [Trematosphaeria pertusa]|uniref:Beta-lactamase/transpeptidase-like protein n=1 Tax=Trematosphaeria pertusa TaxID=390896 RepID=A0A6A6IL51_9PLEO|nr:beta-lactamase/transpeptidase-like protein [Trematosphaeria pertusa]KAF2250939.1 beta-lactamase/transpeptidase-like protein [Trematosphaeria pertusa]
MRFRYNFTALIFYFGLLTLLQLCFFGLPSVGRSSPVPGEFEHKRNCKTKTKELIYRPSLVEPSKKMEAVVKRLAALRPAIEEMLSLTGTAGLTYGGVYRSEVIHIENFRYRDVGQKLPVNEDTIFQVASLTKNMVAATVGMLVEDGKLRWDTPIKDIPPDRSID